MKLLIFQTNIDSKQKVETVQPLFNNHNSILDWSVDTEDIDNVLRIEARENLHETDVINLMTTQGFYCHDSYKQDSSIIEYCWKSCTTATQTAH